MSVKRVAARYAKSIIDLAEERGKLDRVLEDIQYFLKVAENRDFELMLKSPVVNGDKKRKVFKALFADKVDPLTLAFFDIIVNKGREAALDAIAEEFVLQYKHLRHISTVRVTTATPLSEDAIGLIKAKLEASDVTDEHVEVETQVDPSLIGGFVIAFDDKLYDASVAHKLVRLRKDFGKNLYVSDF